MLLCVAAGGSVFLANPASSVMFDTKYFWRFVRCMKRAGLKATCLFAVCLGMSGLVTLLVEYMCRASPGTEMFFLDHNVILQQSERSGSVIVNMFATSTEAVREVSNFPCLLRQEGTPALRGYPQKFEDDCSVSCPVRQSNRNHNQPKDQKPSSTAINSVNSLSTIPHYR